jgi:hypothetical protein
MPPSIPYNFRCPARECLAEYVAVGRPRVSRLKPKCIECGTPFPGIEQGLFIKYEAAWPVTLAPPDDLLLFFYPVAANGI